MESYMPLIAVMYFVYAAIDDLKSRSIYTFPVVFLVIGTTSALISSKCYDWRFLMVFVLLNILLAYLLNIFHVWAEGDSVMLILFATALLFELRNLDLSYLGVAFAELICIAISMALSVVIGVIEMKLRHEKLTKASELAVTPGFCVSLAALLIYFK